MIESPDREDGYEFRHYLGVLWRRKLSIVAPIVLLTVAGWLLGPAPSDSSTSTAQVLAKPVESTLSADGGGAARTDGAIADEIAIISSDEIRDAVEAAVGHSVEVTIEQLTTDSSVVTITVSGTEDDAQRDAQTYAETYVELRRGELAQVAETAIDQLTTRLTDIEAQLAELAPQITDLDTQIGATTDETVLRGLTNQREDLLAQRDVLTTSQVETERERDDIELTAAVTPTLGIELLSNASAPAAVTGVGKFQYASAGFALGLVLGVLLAFAREHFDQSVRTMRDVERAGNGIRLLGVVPRQPRGAIR